MVVVLRMMLVSMADSEGQWTEAHRQSDSSDKTHATVIPKVVLVCVCLSVTVPRLPFRLPQAARHARMGVVDYCDVLRTCVLRDVRSCMHCVSFSLFMCMCWLFQEV